MDTLALLNQMSKNTLVEHLGIVITKAEKGYIEAMMPVDDRTVQPMRLLHGGATAALAETLGSIGSVMLIDHEKETTVGVDLNINHLRSATEGQVIGKAKVIHQGRKVHVWQIDVFKEDGKQISSARLTTMVVPL